MMKWYWVIGCDHTVKDPLVADYSDLKNTDPDILSDGNEIVDWNPESLLKVTKKKNDGVPDDIMQNHLGIPIFSDRLQIEVHKLQIQDIQFLPIEIYKYNGDLIEGFAIANIITLRNALDKNKSDFDIFPNDYFIEKRRGLVRGIRTAVLFAEPLNGTDVIRLKEYPMAIYCSERFKLMFEKFGFTGFSFSEIKLT